MSFLRALPSLKRTQEGLPGRSPIAPSQASLTLEFLVMGFQKKVATYWCGYPYQSYKTLGRDVTSNQPTTTWVAPPDSWRAR
jgi:hypothetical protein